MLSILVLIVIFAVLAMSLDLLMGYTGMESLGQAAFFGIAGTRSRSSARAMTSLGSSRSRSHWSRALSTAAIAGALAVRLTGLFFLVMTLVFAQVLWGLAENWGQVTGGHLGLHGITRPFDALDTDLTFYYVAFGVCLVSGLLMYRLVRSPFGLTLRGIKDSELRMRTSGYNVWLHRFIVFVIAGLFAGIAGVLYTYSTQFISPTILGVETSFEAMLMVIVGGAGTLTGPVIGAAVVTGLRNYLSVVFRQLADRSRAWLTSSPSSSRREGILGLVPRRWRAASRGRTGAGGRRPEPRGAIFALSRWIDGSRPRPIDRDAGRSGRSGNAPTRGHWQDLRTGSCGARSLADGVRWHAASSPWTQRGRQDDVVQLDHRRLQAIRMDPSICSVENVTSVPSHARTRMGLSRTYQITNLFPSLTVMNNVRLGVLGRRAAEVSDALAGDQSRLRQRAMQEPARDGGSLGRTRHTSREPLVRTSTAARVDRVALPRTRRCSCLTSPRLACRWPRAGPWWRLSRRSIPS